jgi:hypothetical protein
MKEELAIEAVLTEKRKIEECLLSKGFSWEEEYSDAYSRDFIGQSEESIDKLAARYNGKYKLKDKDHGINFRVTWQNNTPLVTVTLLDSNDYESKREPREFEVEFKKLEWKNINTSSSTRSFTFYNDGYIGFEKDITTEDYIDKYYYYGQYNPYTKNFRISISRNYVDNIWGERIDMTELEKFGPIIIVKYDGKGKVLRLDKQDQQIVANGEPIYLDEIEKRVDMAKEELQKVIPELLIPGLVDGINYSLKCLEENKFKIERKR